MTDTPATSKTPIDNYPVSPDRVQSVPWYPPVFAALTYLVFWQIAPRVRTESMGAVIISTLFSLALIVWFTASLARIRPTVQFLVLGVVISGSLVLPLKVMLGTGHVLSPWRYLLLVPGLADLLFIWFAACFGTALSLLLRSANMIPPVAAVLALVDTWTVLLGGPVQKIMTSQNPMAKAVSQLMTVPIPAPRVGAAPFKPTSFVGFADFVFIAFFVAALCRLIRANGAYHKTVRTLIFVLCVYMLAVMLLPPSFSALPALVPMAVVMIALHWRNFHYERSEAFAMLYAAIVIVVIVVGFWFIGKRAKPEESEPRACRPINDILRQV